MCAGQFMVVFHQGWTSIPPLQTPQILLLDHYWFKIYPFMQLSTVQNKVLSL